MKLEFDSVEEVIEFVNKFNLNINSGSRFVTIDCGDYKLMVSDGRGDSYHNGNELVNFYEAQQWVDENCNANKLGGYGDWVVPNRDELDLLYENKEMFKGDDSFYDNGYWSSSETSATNAWSQTFSSGYQNSYYKTDSDYVRAVRRVTP